MSIEQKLRQALQYRYAKSIMMKCVPGGGRFPFRLEKKLLAAVLGTTPEELQCVIDKIYEDGGISRDDGQSIDFKKEYIWALGQPKYFD